MVMKTNLTTRVLPCAPAAAGEGQGVSEGASRSGRGTASPSTPAEELQASRRYRKGDIGCQRLIAICATSISRELHRCYELSMSELCWSTYAVINRLRAPSLRVQPGFPSQLCRRHSPVLRTRVLCGPWGSRYRAGGGV